MSIVNVTISVELNEVFGMNCDSEHGELESLIQCIDCIDGVEVIDYLEYHGVVNSSDPYSGYHGREHLLGK